VQSLAPALLDVPIGHDKQADEPAEVIAAEL
jgi:hypothetical protein